MAGSKRRLLDVVDGNREGIISFLQHLVRTPSITGQEGTCAEFISQRLRGMGLEVKWHEAQGAGTAVERAWRDLTAKGTPPLDVDRNARIVHVIFVPQRPRTWVGKTEPIVVDAGDVLAALR